MSQDAIKFAEAVDGNLTFINQVREKLFTHIPADQVKVVHDCDHYIEFGGYLITPVADSVPSLRGPRPVIRWHLAAFREIPGSFNPFNGGSPPDVDEIDLGTHENLPTLLAEIAKFEAMQVIDGVGEALMYEQMAKEEQMWAEMEADRQEQESLCPHGKQFHECNACLIASDLAYDAQRENRTFGRHR